MTLAEKIIRLRKEQGWSQEELAHRLEVSRQAVSKWESMASVPDLDKILKLSQLFGVSTDYLLKDDAAEEMGFAAEMSKTIMSRRFTTTGAIASTTSKMFCSLASIDTGSLEMWSCFLSGARRTSQPITTAATENQSRCSTRSET